MLYSKSSIVLIFNVNATASLLDPFPLDIFQQEDNCKLPKFVVLSFLEGFYSVLLFPL